MRHVRLKNYGVCGKRPSSPMEKTSERERAISRFSVRYRVRVFSEGYISGEAFFQEGFFGIR